MPAEPRFDDSIHALTRLRLCGMLRSLEEADFGTIAATLEISDANLSKTIRNLIEAGYVETSKRPSPARDDARLTTTVRLTHHGRQAFDGHLAALTALAAPAAQSTRPVAGRPDGGVGVRAVP